MLWTFASHTVHCILSTTWPWCRSKISVSTIAIMASTDAMSFFQAFHLRLTLVPPRRVLHTVVWCLIWDHTTYDFCCMGDCSYISYQLKLFQSQPHIAIHSEVTDICCNILVWWSQCMSVNGNFVVWPETFDMILSLSNRQYRRNDTVIVIVVIIIVHLFCSGDASRRVTVWKWRQYRWNPQYRK